MSSSLPESGCRLCRCPAISASLHHPLVLCFASGSGTASKYAIHQQQSVSSVAEVLNQHFWFKLHRKRDATAFVCQPCWRKVSQFHQFYQSVLLMSESQVKPEPNASAYLGSSETDSNPELHWDNWDETGDEDTDCKVAVLEPVDYSITCDELETNAATTIIVDSDDEQPAQTDTTAADRIDDAEPNAPTSADQIGDKEAAADVEPPTLAATTANDSATTVAADDNNKGNDTANLQQQPSKRNTLFGSSDMRERRRNKKLRAIALLVAYRELPPAEIDEIPTEEQPRIVRRVKSRRIENRRNKR